MTSGTLQAPWAPVGVNDVTLAFPAVIERLIPTDEALADAREQVEGVLRRKWETCAQRLFAAPSARLEQDIGVVFRSGIEGEKAWRHLSCVLRTFSLRHEHKIEVAGFLLRTWAVDVFDHHRWKRFGEVLSLVFDRSPLTPTVGSDGRPTLMYEEEDAP